MIIIPKDVCLLDRWVTYGNILVGYIYNSKQFKPKTRVKTDAIIEFDPKANMARCIDGDYKLGEPGTVEEHNVPVL